MHGPMNDISFILLTLQFQQCQIIKITEQLLIKTVVLLLLLLLFGFRTEYEEDEKKCRWKACGIHFDTIFKVLDFICYALINLDSIADEPEKIAFSHRRVRATPIHLPYWISARFSVCRWNISSSPFCLQPIFVCSLTSPTSTDTMHIWYASRVPHTSSTHFH